MGWPQPCELPYQLGQALVAKSCVAPGGTLKSEEGAPARQMLIGTCAVTCMRTPPSADCDAAELANLTTIGPKAVTGATSAGLCEPSTLPSPNTRAATPVPASSVTDTNARLLRFTSEKRSSGMKPGAVGDSEMEIEQEAGDGCEGAPAAFVEMGAISCAPPAADVAASAGDVCSGLCPSRIVVPEAAPHRSSCGTVRATSCTPLLAVAAFDEKRSVRAAPDEATALGRKTAGTAPVSVGSRSGASAEGPS